MTAVSADRVLSRTAAAQYWARVRLSMVEIFNMSSAEAGRRITALRSAQERSPGGGSAADYHVEPLRVAADLAGRGVSTAHIRRYLKLSAGAAGAPRLKQPARATKPKFQQKASIPRVSAPKPALRRARKPNPEPAAEHNFAGMKAV